VVSELSPGDCGAQGYIEKCVGMEEVNEAPETHQKTA